MGMDLERLEDRIRHLASEGMGIKRDLLPLYADQEYMGELIRYLAEPFRGKVDCVCAPEPMGLIVGSMLAHELGTGCKVAGIAAIGADNRTAAKNLIDSGTVLCAYCGKE